MFSNEEEEIKWKKQLIREKEEKNSWSLSLILTLLKAQRITWRAGFLEANSTTAPKEAKRCLSRLLSHAFITIDYWCGMYVSVSRLPGQVKSPSDWHCLLSRLLIQLNWVSYFQGRLWQGLPHPAEPIQMLDHQELVSSYCPICSS